MAAVASNVSGLFSDLARFNQSGEWEKALRTANKILQQTPDDVKAFHCKIICQIQLSQFQEALNAINHKHKLSSELHFEKAYCLYRLNQIQESLAVLQNVPEPSVKIKELKAQALYRLEKYEECFDTYRDIIKNTQDDFEDERETNLSAVICHLKAADSKLVKDHPEIQGQTYEMCYNSACIALAQGKLQEGTEKLLKAEELCRKSLEEDDALEDEIESELGIIRVQLGYAYQIQGKKDAALKLYNLVVKQRPSDIGLLAVASNNIVTINKDQNVFDSKKKMKSATVDGLQHKLTSQQQLQIAVNSCLLLMYTNQLEQCKNQLKRLNDKYPNFADAILILAALYCREKQIDNAVEILQNFAAKHPELSFTIPLTQVQLFLSQGYISQACEILRSLQDSSFRPGIVSALVTLHLSLEDKEMAAEVLHNAINWYKKNKPNAQELHTLWRESANFHLRNGNPELAVKSLEELRIQNPKDMKVLAHLISAYSRFDPKKAQSISNELPPISELLASVDVDTLETTNWIMGAKYIKKSAKTEPSPAVAKGSSSSELIVKKKRKNKKGKLPKNYNADVDPDAERWLPRRERSTYKKRKDKRGGVGKGTQGATTSSTDIDASKHGATAASSPRAGGSAGSTPTTSATAISPAAQGPRQQRPQPLQKKKKKAKGKW